MTEWRKEAAKTAPPGSAGEEEVSFRVSYQINWRVGVIHVRGKRNSVYFSLNLLPGTQDQLYTFHTDSLWLIYCSKSLNHSHRELKLILPVYFCSWILSFRSKVWGTTTADLSPWTVRAVTCEAIDTCRNTFSSHRKICFRCWTITDAPFNHFNFAL